MKQLLIKNGLVVTQNDARDILRRDILIHEGKIGKIAQDIPLQPHTEVIDATDKIVLPGLINCHLHSDAFVYKGLGDDLRLFQQIEDPFLNKIWDALTLEQLHAAALGTYYECIKNGTTFVNDFMYSQFFIRELVSAMKKTGIRGAITSYDFSHESDIANEDFLKMCKDASIIPIIKVPAEEFMAEDKLHQVQRHPTFLHQGHILECKERLDLIMEKFHMTTLELLEQHQLVTPHLHVVHGNQVSDKDIAIMAHHRASFVVVPSAEMLLADGIYDIRRLITKDILIGIGSDGAIWSNANDLFREMKTLVLHQKSLYGVTALSAQKVLDMATRDAATMFGIADKVGSLEPGKEADIILVDMQSFNLAPIILGPKSNVVSNLIYCATGNDVTHTIIKGKILMENRKLTGTDEHALLRNIQSHVTALMQSIDKTEHKKWREPATPQQHNL